MADMVNANTIKVITERDYTKFPNIILMDYYDRSSLIHLAKFLNQWGWLARTQKPAEDQFASLGTQQPLRTQAPQQTYTPPPVSRQPSTGPSLTTTSLMASAARTPVVQDAFVGALANPTIRNAALGAMF